MRRWSLELLSGSCRPARTCRAVLVSRIGRVGTHSPLPGPGNNQCRILRVELCLMFEKNSKEEDSVDRVNEGESDGR